MERLPELIVPFKRKVYESVCARFAPLAGVNGKGPGTGPCTRFRS